MAFAARTPNDGPTPVDDARVEGAPGSSCRHCRSALRHVVVDLGASPLSQSFLTAERLGLMEPTYPLRLFVCDACWLVQLDQYASPAEIFSDYAYFSSYSDTWLDHARRYVDQAVATYGLGRESRVVEIASNDGYLLQYFLARGVPVLGVEPAANVARVAEAKGIPTRVEFFGAALARRLVEEGGPADLLVANNVFAHVPDLEDFVRGLKVLLAPDGVVTLEFPHLVRLIEENQFDTIYHEHLSYFSLHSADRVLAARGLRVFDVEELPTHGGSLRVHVCHAAHSTRRASGRVAAVKAQEAAAGYEGVERYLAFSDQVRETRWALLDFLVTVRRQGASVAGYGAPAKGNTLLNYCGIRPDLVEYTVDRSPHKQGLFTPGTRLPILHPDRIAETRPDYLLILCWNLREEVMAQMAHIGEWGGRFVLPIPAVRVAP